MKSSMAGTLQHQEKDERIEVLRIRLWNFSNATAVLSDTQSADRVIATWGRGSGCLAVRFEVNFVDGFVVEGCHEFFKKGRRKCMFSTHLRRMMMHMADAENFANLPPQEDASRYVFAAS